VSGLGSLTISVLPGFSSIRDSPLNNALRANGVEPNAITAEHSVILLRLEVYTAVTIPAEAATACDLVNAQS